MRTVARHLTMVTGAAALVLACSLDSPDRAAKRRIFSPEDAAPAVASAQETLASDGLGKDPQLARRVLQMGAAETTERLGAHRLTASMKFDWSAKGAGELGLSENRTLLAGPGGVSGDFHATVTNNRGEGMDVIRAHGDVYARGRYGRFRQRLRDRGMAERRREEVFGGLRDFDSMFRERLALQPQGQGQHEGRTVQRYRVSLGPAVAAQAEPPSPLPPLAAPKGGADATTLSRRHFFEAREPQDLSGEIWVDEETAAVVHAKLEGKLKVPASKDRPQATVRMMLDSTLTGIGQTPEIHVPKAFLPDEDKPLGIADTLDRYGIPRQGMDAGTVAPPAKRAAEDAEPAEEDDSQ